MVFSISVSSVIHHHVICVICGSFLAFRHLSIGVAHFRAFSDRNPVGTGLGFLTFVINKLSFSLCLSASISVHLRLQILNLDL